MFEIKNGNIYINRNEKAELTVDIFMEDEKGDKRPYELLPGDRLRLRVLAMPEYKILLEKFAEGYTFYIKGSDTKDLSGQLAFSVGIVFADGSEAFVIAPSDTEIPRFFVLEA